MGPPILALLLLPGTLQLAGGLSVTHTGAPIMVSLADRAVTFVCSISYKYTPPFQNFQVSYYYRDVRGRRSSTQDTNCKPSSGTVNQTATLTCSVTPSLPSAAATGTYYCSVLWGSKSATGNGTFILVRDLGYQEPLHYPQKLLLFCFLGILMLLSVLGTAALFWRKKQVKGPKKPPARKCPDSHPASSSKQPPAESIYTALQRQDTEVYDSLQDQAGSPRPAQNLLPKVRAHRLQSDSDLNLVYENL
ncbi:NFAT activation molecule 1 [Sorex araneus]|uniref:NFAT activation molecule 1 n=1 Tax=Sorex araneus TaxID=42254 RepID=UPI00033153B9|nr:NFAT activation molecule 1 [Sorex araneus]